MENFNYQNPARIAFGRNVEENLEKLLREEDIHALLLVYSGDFIKALGIYDIVKRVSARLDIAFYEDGNVVPNPEISLVRKLSELGKRKGIEFILAVGGGSSVDTAKATALGIPYEGDAWDFFDKGAVPAKVLPVGVITTLPSSGSETSNAAILSNCKSKLGFEDDRIIPHFAIMNPEYTLGLPRHQTSAGIADILSHLLERYFTNVTHVDVTDYLIEGAVRALLADGAKVNADPSDYDSRAEIQWLASIAHNNLLDTGRIGDWASHRIEHELSAQYGITHGEGMAIVTLAWLKYMADQRPFKPAQLAVRVFGADPYVMTDREQVLYLRSRLELFFKSLGLVTTLRELGIDDSRFDDMAKSATKNGTSPVGHYVPVDAQVFKDILKLAL